MRETVVDGRVLGFLDGSSTLDWQGHTIMLIKMPSGQPSITQSAPFLFQHWNAGLQPSRSDKQI